MKKTIAIVYASAVINLCGTSWVIGVIWFGWGLELVGDRLGLILWGLFLNSIVLVFGLLMIAMVEIIARRVNKKYQRLEVKKDSLERSFLEEWLKRNLDSLTKEDMKEVMVNWLMVIEKLSEYVELLGGKRPHFLKNIKSDLESLPPRLDKD